MHRVVPELIVENYRAGKYGGEFPAMGMFLDLSGFSTMTDALMQHGQHGAEVLAALMHGVFDPLVRSIFEHGGRIVSFAGDGIMALYPVEKDETLTALRALASAWTIQKQLLETPARQTIYGQFSFSVKIGLAAGSVAWRIVRSEDGGQATYYFRGSTVDLAADAEHHARAGEIVLTNVLTKLLDGMIETSPHAPFHRFERFLVDTPKATPCVLPPVDVDSSRIFMPADVVVHDIRGEFRQIVNLFVRIPDLTDEELEEFMDEVFRLRKRYGGLLTRIDFGDKGCNLLMLWGAPIAYENDISRALNFILELREKTDFPVTAGVTYYIAHAGYLGSEMCEDYTCYGWGVNLASRFMMNAPDGEIWVDERIRHRISQSFDFDYVGSQYFKGFAAEQKVNLLRGRKDADVVYQGEMVGRQFELEQLVQFVEPLWRGHYAGVMAVSGDAGIGKGMLVHAFNTSELFKEHKNVWAVCRADQILRQSFNPIRRWLLRYFRLSSDQTPEERKQAFDARLDELTASIPDPELARELERTSSILGALVDVHWNDSLYSQLDAEGRYNNTFLALIALMKAESLRQPFVLFVDDVHFIDEDSRKLLVQLKRSLSSAPAAYPVAIILTYRKQGFQPLQDELPDTEISLAGISRLEVAHLAEILLGGTASAELIDLVVSRSEGNPFFAQQVIRYLQEESLLEMSKAGWKHTRRGRSSVLPGDIRALLVARLDQLRQEVKDVVQTASVLGREFEVHVLAQMLGPEWDTEEHVSEAEKAAVWMPLQEMRYIFHHALLRDAAYTMQMRARRRELHALAVSALEEVYADTLKLHYAELAYHSENADLPMKAREYYTLAGQAASELFRNDRALDYFTRAMSYAPANDLPGQFDILMERTKIYNRLGDRPAQLQDIQASEKLAVQLSDKDLLARAHMQYASYYYFVGDYRNSIEYARLAEEGSLSIKDDEQALYTQVVWCTSLLRLGRLDEAMQRAKETLERDKKAGNRREEGRVLNVMGLIALEQKEPSLAGNYFTEALSIVREIKDLDIEAKATNNIAMVEGSINGNYVLAHEYYLESYRITIEMGDRASLCLSLGNLGFTAIMLGDFPTARSYYERALAMARETGNLYQETYAYINLSALAGILGESEPALQNAQLALELAHRTFDLSSEAWAQLYLGHAHLLNAEFEQAQTAYRASIKIRDDLNQPALSMEPIAGLLHAYMRADDLESAAPEAEKILQFLEGGEALDGTDEPLRVYYTCYRFLEKTKDPRAGQILQKAKALLEAQVSRFSNEAERRRYIENIPWRRAIRDAVL